MNLDTSWLSAHREYLKAAYELGELKDRNGVPPAEILEHLRLGEKKGEAVLEFLVETGMVVWPAKGELLLTELGLRKAQELEGETGRPAVTSPSVTPAPYLYHSRRLRPTRGHLTRA